MTGYSVARTTFAAAALLAASLTATMAADLGTQPAAGGAEGTRVAVPLPKARPAYMHKRVARTHWRRAIVWHESAPPSRPYWFWRPREQVVAQWPVLMVGIGF